jgi:arylsulfatase
MILGGVLAASAAKRNVIVVLTDDYGCGEHSFYGNEIIETPHLDKLAKQSVLFDNFHVSSCCAPTRAQLMSGKHEFRVGVTHTMYPRAYLNLREKLLPEYFKDGGYSTAHFGKWHLGNDVFDDEYSARARGFDTSLVSHYREHFDPELILDGKLVPYKGFRTDILFEEAQKWMDLQLAKDQPFFCYIAPNSAHSPFDCPDEYKEKYFAKMDSQALATYYGMVDNIDANMGKLMVYMQEKGLWEDTLLIYLTDNGHVGHGYNAGMRGKKCTQYRGGTRVPCLFHCPESFPGGRTVPDLTGAIDILSTLVDLCGLKMDKTPDGTSLVPLLESDDAAFPDRFMVCHVGRWKDGAADRSKYSKMAVQNRRFRLVDNAALYDIDNDPGETTNVINQYPELVSEMRAFYDHWWADTRPMMINEDRAVREGGSRLSVDDVEFRQTQQNNP